MIQDEVDAASRKPDPLDDDLDAACINNAPPDLTHIRLLMQL
ncbi:hypothetical protein CGMCC3_g17875 [Colletotrichum fructicola]|nr:uncharacterized protein CGMCC3_g17875 [Colletotrichum fructicola]KAE9565946.1 hypothetical protein CGMCC3_g17875 [Colletotrichum fructicola]